MYKHKIRAIVTCEVAMADDVETSIHAEKKLCKELVHLEKQLKNSLYLLADCIQVDITETEREKV